MLKNILCVVAVCFSLSCNADIHGVVVKVLDGDTIDVYQVKTKETQRVRLSGIDAPEKEQPFGQRSRQFLSSLVARHHVTVKEHGKDRYGRVLGIVTSYDIPPNVPVIDLGVNVNELMLIQGMAQAYRYHEKAVNPHYALIEETAKRHKIGLWSDEKAIEPWKWRENHKIINK